jgi:hypothetical protein
MVGVTGLEPVASCSQSRRATNCATPRIFVDRNGFEPLTPCVQGRCSSQLS